MDMYNVMACLISEKVGQKQLLPHIQGTIQLKLLAIDRRAIFMLLQTITRY